MIRIDINQEGVNEVRCEGEMLDIMGELTYVVHKILTEAIPKEKQNAVFFAFMKTLLDKHNSPDESLKTKTKPRFKFW